MFGNIFGDVFGSSFKDNNHRNFYFEEFPINTKFTGNSVISLSIYEFLNNIEFNSIHYDLDSFYLKLQVDCCSYLNRGYSTNFYNWLILTTETISYIDDNIIFVIALPIILWGRENNISTLEQIKIIELFLLKIFNLNSISNNFVIFINILNNLSIYKNDKSSSHDMILHSIQNSENLVIHKHIDSLRVNENLNNTIDYTISSIITCFIHSNTHDEFLHNIVSIGGDSSILCCIAGAISEIYWTEEINTMENKNKILKYFKPFDSVFLNHLNKLIF